MIKTIFFDWPINLIVMLFGVPRLCRWLKIYPVGTTYVRGK